MFTFVQKQNKLTNWSNRKNETSWNMHFYCKFKIL